MKGFEFSRSRMVRFVAKWNSICYIPVARPVMRPAPAKLTAFQRDHLSALNAKLADPPSTEADLQL
jgi:hypothetical protein